LQSLILYTLDGFIVCALSHIDNQWLYLRDIVNDVRAPFATRIERFHFFFATVTAQTHKRGLLYKLRLCPSPNPLCSSVHSHHSCLKTCILYSVIALISELFKIFIFSSMNARGFMSAYNPSMFCFRCLDRYFGETQFLACRTTRK